MKDKAIPQATPKRVKGTVLFTVVAVMMILIVFLMGTLSLAATANNRANANYQKVQTETLARTVLDAVVKSIEADEDASGIRKDVIAEDDIEVSLDGETYTVSTEKLSGDRYYYDAAKQTWEVGTVYQLSVTVDKTKADTTYTALVTAKTETTPPSGGGGGGGGAFVSMGSTSTIGTGGFVTGGTYVGIDPTLPQPAGGYTLGQNDPYIDAPYYVNGNLAGGNGNRIGIHYTAPGEKFVVMGSFTETKANQFTPDYTDFKWGSVSSTMDYRTDTPYIFIKDNMNILEMVKIGCSDVPTNLYCGSMTIGKGVVIYGDIYNFDPNGNNTINKVSTSADTALYKWAKSGLSITNNPDGSNVYGSWYSRGNIEFYFPSSEKNIQGDLRSEKNITIKPDGGTLNVGGDIVCGGVLYLTGGNNPKIRAKNVYADTIVIEGGMECNFDNVYCTHLVGSSGTLNAGTINYVDQTYTAPPADVYMTKRVTTTEEVNTTTGTRSEDVVRPDWGGAIEHKTYFWREYDIKTTVTITYSDGTVDASNVTVVSQPRVEQQWNPPGGYSSTYKEENFTAPAVAPSLSSLSVTVNGAQNGGLVSGFINGTKYKTPSGEKDIYPTDYTSANIKTTINLETPLPADYSSMKTDSSTFLPMASDATFNGSFPTSEANYYYDSSIDCYVIKAACHLKGISFDKNVYIDPTDDFKVVLENCSLSSNRSIIVNDSVKQVTLYIIGNFNINNNGGIFTEWYWKKMVSSNLNTDFPAATGSSVDIKQVHTNPADPDYPNVVIASDAGAEMHLTNQTCITAMVRAPQMLFQQSQAWTSSSVVNYENAYGGVVKYVGGHSSQTLQSDFDASKNKLDSVGVIGQLIAEEIQLDDSRNWGMIYVTQPTGTTPPTPPTPGLTNPFAGESTILGYDYY